MAEKVNLQEFAKGYITPSSWFKSFGIVSKFLILIAVGWAVYVTFILPHIKKPEPSQTQQTTIESPGQVNIDQRQQIIETEKDTFFMGVKLWRIKFGFSLLRQSRQALPTGSEVRADSKTLKPSAGSDVR